MALKDWSTVANDNDDADASINWTEGQAPSTVNGSARSMMAAIREWYDDTPRVPAHVSDDMPSYFGSGACGRMNFMPGGTYTLASLLDNSAVSLSDCYFVGVPGETVITGAFGVGIFKLGAMSNVHFHGITFESTVTDAVEDTGTGVVYSQGKDVLDVSFTRCKFTAPNANTNGLAIYARDSSSSTAAVINGLWVEDCNFEALGRIGCVLMNRGTASDKYDAAMRVYFRRNKGKNLGINGNYGFLVTLDGFGSAFNVDENELEKCLGIGIENTGWCHGSLSHNRFRDFTRAYAPFGFSGNTMTGLTVEGNKTVVGASTSMNIFNIDKSTFRDNYFEMNTDGQSQVAVIRDCNDNYFSGNKWIDSAATNGRYAVLIESSATTCKRNKFVDEFFSTAASAGNFSVVRFNGASCSENQLINPTIAKGTGGLNYDELTATNNLVFRANNATTDLYFNEAITHNFTSDADYTLILAQRDANNVTMTDTGVVLSTGRNVVLPNHRRSWIVRNSTLQTLTFKTSAGTGIAVAAARSAVVYGNGTNILRATADVA